MPILDPATALDDPDASPRPVVAFGVKPGTDRMEVGAHRHRKGELLLTMRGALTCEVGRRLWIVPPQCAIWIPGGAVHDVRAIGAIETYCLFFAGAPARLPEGCCTVAVTPLLRELVLRCATFPALYPERGAEANLATLLLDELAAAPVETLHLPMPSDPRLRRLAARLTADPSDRATTEVWARRVGVSGRTLSRILLRETGMSFGRWRQQLHIVLALQRLSSGASVQEVASGLGYESAGSFVTMFKRALGAPPARYMAQRRAGRD